MEVGKDEDDLPLVYEPERIAQFWARRPVAVATRVAQLLSIGGGFISGLLWDLANGSFAKNEVRRPLHARTGCSALLKSVDSATFACVRGDSRNGTELSGMLLHF